MRMLTLQMNGRVVRELEDGTKRTFTNEQYEHHDIRILILR
jgi:hypothetical protein